MRCLCALAVLLLVAPCGFAATYTVSSSGDAGPGTLRQAILDANGNPGPDQIVFTAGGVNVATSLPPITDRVAIDGTVGGDRVTITGVFSDCNTGLDFGAGSDYSSLQEVIVRGFCRSLHIADGVGNIRVLSNDFANEVLVDGDNNVFRSTLGPDVRNAWNVIGTLRITGGGNFVVSTDVESLQLLFGRNNWIGMSGQPNTIGTCVVNPADALFSMEYNVFPGTPARTGTAISIVDAVSPHHPIMSNNRITGYETGIKLTSTPGNPPPYVWLNNNLIANTSIPIDLGGDGPTPNDPAPDADAGPNGLQNYPILTSAVLTPAGLVVSGTLTSAPSSVWYSIHLFSNPPSDPAGANVLLGSTGVGTDAAGHGEFNVDSSSHCCLLRAAEIGEFVTAMASWVDAGSELSPPVPVTGPSEIALAAATHSVDESAGSVAITVQRSGDANGTVMVHYATANGTAAAPADFTDTTGTLVFSPGVTTRTIVVPIVDDDEAEELETFTLVLSAVTAGNTLGASTATVTIQQNSEVMIPTLSAWGLIALALGLAALFLRIR